MMSKNFNMQEWHCSHCGITHITQHMGVEKARCPKCSRQTQLQCDLNARQDCYSDHVEWHIVERVSE